MKQGSVTLVMRVRLVGATVGALALLTGCSGFFPPLPTTTGGGGTPVTTTGDFVYVANGTKNSIAGFVVATTSAGVGTLTAVAGSPYAFPLSPTSMVLTPSNTFLYAAGIGGIYVYSVNGTTGVLTVGNSGGAVAVSQLGTVSIDISPDGQWLFSLAADGATIEEYQINASTGALSIHASTQYTVLNGATVTPRMIKVAPNGAYVFVALGTGGDLIFPFTTSTGTLGTTYGRLATGSTQTSDNALTVDSGSTFLYIARSGASNGVAVYSIGTNGTLNSVAGSPFAAGNGPYSVVINSTGKYVYAANRTDGSISGYSIGTGGVLTALGGSPYVSAVFVNSLAVDKSGSYVLATASEGAPDLTMYSFDTATAGKLNSAATTATGTDPTGAIAVVATH